MGEWDLIGPDSPGPFGDNPSSPAIRRKRGRVTREELSQFVELLNEGYPERVAADKIGVRIETIRLWRDREPAFADAWDDAIALSIEEVEHRMRERAMDPEDRDSAKLMMAWLKGNMPHKYGDRVQIDEGPQKISASVAKRLQEAAKRDPEAFARAAKAMAEAAELGGEVVEVVEAEVIEDEGGDDGGVQGAEEDGPDSGGETDGTQGEDPPGGGEAAP